MSSLTDVLLGTIRLHILCADMEGLLKALKRGGVPVRDFSAQSDLEAAFSVPGYGRRKCCAILSRRGVTYTITQKRGILAWLGRHKDRLPLGLCIGVLTAFFLWLPTRVLFLETEGAETVYPRQILAAAEVSGIRFFGAGAEIRSEHLKNHLLGQLPQLQWAGINCNGSLAVITVRERTDTQSPMREEGYSDIVASRDGIVVSISVLEGQTRCHVGQAVRKGELLVSGCVDHEFQPQYTHSEAEIFALTQHPVDLAIPASWHKKVYTGRETTRWSLLVGRKRINLSGNSGILPTTCDKIYRENYVRLPGGWQLPLGLVRETLREYTLQPEPLSRQEAEDILQGRSRAMTRENMLAGEILCCQQESEAQKGRYVLHFNYTCREMIARQRKLYLFEGDGANDGTNH